MLSEINDLSVISIFYSPFNDYFQDYHNRPTDNYKYSEERIPVSNRNKGEISANHREKSRAGDERDRRPLSSKKRKPPPSFEKYDYEEEEEEEEEVRFVSFCNIVSIKARKENLQNNFRSILIETTFCFLGGIEAIQKSFKRRI